MAGTPYNPAHNGPDAAQNTMFALAREKYGKGKKKRHGQKAKKAVFSMRSTGAKLRDYDKDGM